MSKSSRRGGDKRRQARTEQPRFDRGDEKVPDSDFTTSLLLDDVCPRCLGDLDTKWCCAACGFHPVKHIEDIGVHSE